MRAVAHKLGFRVVIPSEIPGLPQAVVSQLLFRGGSEWSGGAISLPNGEHVILINPHHSAPRHATTIAEEVVHIKLDHKLTRIELDGQGLILRGYDRAKEIQAKAVAAATLVPHGPLAQAARERTPIAEIAAHFDVSAELVKFRLKVKRLWGLYD
jgi:Zn-dependent peptidase ImmA (M78 family)